MKAILVDEQKNLVWSDVPDPVIGDDDVLVKKYMRRHLTAQTSCKDRESTRLLSDVPNGWDLKSRELSPRSGKTSPKSRPGKSETEYVPSLAAAVMPNTCL